MVSVITRSKNEQSDTTTVNVNNEKQGTDAHVSNTSDDGINRIITESNWIQQWTKEDLVNHQTMMRRFFVQLLICFAVTT